MTILKRYFSINIFFFLGMLIFFTQGCSKWSYTIGVYNSSGIYISPAKLQKIKNGLYQSEIFDILGSPTFINSFNKNIWYYIYQKTWYISIFSEKLIDQQILILTFNNDSALINIEHKDLKDVSNLVYDKSRTNFSYKKNHINPDIFN